MLNLRFKFICRLAWHIRRARAHLGTWASILEIFHLKKYSNVTPGKTNVLCRDSPSSTIKVFSTSTVFHWKSSNVGESHPCDIKVARVWAGAGSETIKTQQPHWQSSLRTFLTFRLFVWVFLHYRQYLLLEMLRKVFL